MKNEYLIDTVIEQLKEDIFIGDLSAIFELLETVEYKYLVDFIGEF